MTLLDREREALARALDDAGLDWERWLDGTGTAPLDARVRLSALLVLLGHEGPDDHRVEETFDRLRRRRLPWDPATACLALEVVRQRSEFDHCRVGAGLRGAASVCGAGLADTVLVDQLDRCRSWLDDLSPELWAVPRMRLLVRRVLATATPPDLVDLSLITDGDGWGVPARDLARRADADVVGPLIRRLGELGPRKPSQRWVREVQEAVRPDAARELVRAWLDVAAFAPIVEPDETTAFSGGMLFAPGNEEVVRAAVLATTVMPSEAWAPAVLGVLARRGAATSGVAGMTASLSLKVASAAIDALIVRATPGDRAVLEELLVDLSRRDLVKRIGVALGRPEEAAARDAQLRREKAAAVRRKADPAPREARAAADRLVRQHLGPALRRSGFSAGGRTWRRLHLDRVDVVSVGSGAGEIQLSYGTRFDAAHPGGEACPMDRAQVRLKDLDIQVYENWDATDEALARCAARLLTSVVPFLDTLGRYELARSYLEHGAGVPPGAAAMNNPGSPADQGVLGLLALAAADRPTAVDQLIFRVRFAQEQVDDGFSSDAELRFWRRQLARARRLPVLPA
ncbi:hypothetical protein [Nocardioides sp. CCNWLW212]|uniref:hypothetical protein n=1 Tax=Nocardioides sp. CCNWLW212 TaxID=3128897 RepID=UPI00307F4997